MVIFEKLLLTFISFLKAMLINVILCYLIYYYTTDTSLVELDAQT